jgi:acetyl-CoA C-acetyltransferase
MSQVADRTPVIIGVGQASERPDDPEYRALSHMDLAGEALRQAIADCVAVGDVPGAIDTIAAIRQFENSTPHAQRPFGGSNNPPRSIGRRVGADPDRAILEVSGGQANQKLVGELATDIAQGRSRVAAIVGAEAISTVLTLTARGKTPDWSEEIDGSLEDRGYGLDGLMDPALARHGAVGAIPVYALFDNARRAKLGLTPEAYRREIGALFAPFTEVAARNPHAASREVRSAEELATVTERNRIVAEPYTRMTVARDQVNQGAAILLASAEAARELGVQEDRWVHIHAVTNAMELTPLRRPDLATGPASWRSLDAALDIAGRSIADMAFLDFYSCFAIPVFNAIDHLGLAPDDPRGLTLTGGLPFFGGAGNNYSAHAIVEAVQRLRAAPGSFALVGANGGVMSKYATGIYSTQPADWSGGSRWTKLDDAGGGLPLAETAGGDATIDSYTVIPGKGDPLAVVIARNASGARLVARAQLTEAAAREVFTAGEVFGRRILISSDEKGRNTFALAS